MNMNKSFYSIILSGLMMVASAGKITAAAVEAISAEKTTGINPVATPCLTALKYLATSAHKANTVYAATEEEIYAKYMREGNIVSQLLIETLKKATKELEEAEKILERTRDAAKAKEIVVSHNIRTRLSNIRTSLEEQLSIRKAQKPVWAAQSDIYNIPKSVSHLAEYFMDKKNQALRKASGIYRKELEAAKDEYDHHLIECPSCIDQPQPTIYLKICHKQLRHSKRKL